MKMRPVLLATLLAATLSPLQSAWAGGNHTIAVSATVNGTCVVNTANSTLAFGPLDPAAGGTVNATWSGGTFRCTNGTTYAVSSDNGLYESGSGGTNNRMRRAGASDCGTPVTTNCIRYTLTSTIGGTGAGMTAPIDFNVTGSTNLADYQDATQGSYADTVTLTVSP